MIGPLKDALGFITELFPNNTIRVNQQEKRIVIMFDSEDDARQSASERLYAYTLLTLKERETGATKFAVVLDKIDNELLGFLEFKVQEQKEAASTPGFGASATSTNG